MNEVREAALRKCYHARGKIPKNLGGGMSPKIRPAE